ncbi:hypothetical protein BBP40_010109 [Aspergillus hancockii]|nr:hypothetical protein BBP40_010109 [Aspergillus hancockii]
MQFWVGWALWQKLSFVLAGLLALVLIYSLCVLIYNRRAIKRHAAADAHIKAIHDAEEHPMLSEANEVPFGARALERGLQVEGIWTPGRNSPKEPSTPKKKEIVEPALNQFFTAPAITVQRPTQTYMPLSQANQSDSRRPSVVPDKKPEISENLYSNTLHINKRHQSGTHDVSKPQDLADPDNAYPKGRFNARSSWISKPFDKRMSGIEGFHQRTSSEEFRRRMSKLFDENVQTPPVEMFQLQSVPSQSSDSQHEPHSHTSMRRSNLAI